MALERFSRSIFRHANFIRSIERPIHRPAGGGARAPRSLQLAEAWRTRRRMQLQRRPRPTAPSSAQCGAYTAPHRNASPCLPSSPSHYPSQLPGAACGGATRLALPRARAWLLPHVLQHLRAHACSVGSGSLPRLRPFFLRGRTRRRAAGRGARHVRRVHAAAARRGAGGRAGRTTGDTSPLPRLRPRLPLRLRLRV
jgi:hypothetical protein